MEHAVSMLDRQASIISDLKATEDRIKEEYLWAYKNTSHNIAEAVAFLRNKYDQLPNGQRRTISFAKYLENGCYHFKLFKPRNGLKFSKLKMGDKYIKNWCLGEQYWSAIEYMAWNSPTTPSIKEQFEFELKPWLTQTDFFDAGRWAHRWLRSVQAEHPHFGWLECVKFLWDDEAGSALFSNCFKYLKRSNATWERLPFHTVSAIECEENEDVYKEAAVIAKDKADARSRAAYNVNRKIAKEKRELKKQLRERNAENLSLMQENLERKAETEEKAIMIEQLQKKLHEKEVAIGQLQGELQEKDIENAHLKEERNELWMKLDLKKRRWNAEKTELQNEIRDLKRRKLNSDSSSGDDTAESHSDSSSSVHTADVFLQESNTDSDYDLGN